MFGIVRVLPRKWSALLEIIWQFKQSGGKVKSTWRITVLAMAWGIWLERNKRLFEDRSSSVGDVWDYIRFLVGLWAKASRVFDSSERFLFGVDSFNFCC
ncbi:hypothetical protein LguiA_019157 [Lonicera macranthoides]